ncbi:MAG TPA: ABC transporter permease [Gemmatimonadaceae bacterium]|jgi:putative ABC transport system permease protein
MLRGLGFRLRALFDRRRVERDMEREMQLHVEMETARLVRDGVDLAEAQRRAAIAFGGRVRFREEARDELRSRHAEEVMRDIGHALRVFRRTPSLTATVVLTLAVGIGATTVVFSVTDHVVLRALPYANADRLVNVQIVSDISKLTNLVPVNAAHFVAWTKACSSCEAIAALGARNFTLTGVGDPTQIAAVRVSDNFFSMLGVHAEVGRLFTLGDDQPGAAGQVVISDALWRQQFGARSDIVGQTLRLNDAPWRVIGVVSPAFQMLRNHELGDLTRLPNRTDAYVPLALAPQEIASHGQYDFSVLALLEPGVSVVTARAELDAANAHAQAAMGEEGPAARTSVTPLQGQVVRQAGRPLMLLLAAVTALLLLMCVNLANLFLARSASRRRESAVRLALGADRGRLVRQALTETALLTIGGAVLGIASSFWGVRALVAGAPADLPRINEVTIDARILVGATLLSVLAGLSFGLVPAWRFGRVSPGDVLKEGARGATDGRHGTRARSLLIAAQVAMSALLLIAGGLLLKSFVRVLGVDKGFTADRVLALNVVVPRGTYPTLNDRNQLYVSALDALRQVPGVSAAALTSALPIEGETWVDGLRVGDHGPSTTANFRFVSPTAFSVLGQPFLRGRTFLESDRGRRVVVLSTGAAQLLWPGENPIGRAVFAGSDSTYEVVGIVPDVRTSGLEHAGSVIAYKPYWEIGPSAVTLVVRTSGDPIAVASSARAALRTVAASVPVSRIRTMDDVISGAMAQRRFELVLIGLFALTALLTATIGIYGIIAHSLAHRTGEISIRIALGARSLDVHGLVLVEVLRPVAIGLLVGVATSLLAGRLLAGMLFEVRSTDVTVLTSVVAVLTVVAVVACLVPARRAARTDPADALRSG